MLRFWIVIAAVTMLSAAIRDTLADGTATLAIRGVGGTDFGHG